MDNVLAAGICWGLAEGDECTVPAGGDLAVARVREWSQHLDEPVECHHGLMREC